MRWWWFMALVACGELESGPAALSDAAAIDATPDALGAAPDAMPDAARDAGPDSGVDAGLDSGVDATPSRDAVPDAAPAPDASWGGCVVEGTPGRCLDTAACAAPHRPVPGHCPGPAHIQCCVDLEEPADCDPEARPRPNAGLVEAPGDPGCPPGMAGVDAFCVDRFEASLPGHSPYHHPADPLPAQALEGAVPQGYIDGLTAEAACVAAGKRLCTDAEWLRACRGPEERTFPYGDARRPGVCNDARDRHPAVELFPNDPNPFARIQHPCINQLPDGLARTGDHPDCVTPEGVFDMMGNLHEWTAAPDGTFRGGFYVDTVRNGPGCLYRTTAHNRQHWDYSTGFRCCADRL